MVKEDNKDDRKIKTKMNKSENGEVIVEATIVFPIMFIVLFSSFIWEMLFILKQKWNQLLSRKQ